MKKILSVLIAASLLLMSSCKKSFIDILPVSTVTIDNLYKTNKDFLDATTGAYVALRSTYTDMWQFGDLRGDDSWIQISNQPNSTAIDLFSINSSNPLLVSMWSNNYVVISRVNMLLSRIQDADPAVVTDKERFIGEAKFMRALAYFNLVRIFGDVQMITDPLTVDETAATPRIPPSTVYSEVIIKDLVDAAEKLPVEYSTSEVGRATKGAAKAILGKVYLTVGDFVKAETVLRELTQVPFKYDLLPDFNYLYNYTADEHHSEYIFDIEYEEGLGNCGSVWTNNFMPNCTPLLNYYGITGGFNESLCPTERLIDLFPAGDLRKDVSVQCCGSFTNPETGEVAYFHSSTSQSYTKKYITPVATNGDSRANWKVIRFADVLLMYAEALNENGKTDLALGQLNRVRTRAGLDAYTDLSQEEARESIEIERRLELCFEGHRWFDLVRTGKAMDACADQGMKDYMTVFPVPLREVQVINDHTIFPQNQGYN